MNSKLLNLIAITISFALTNYCNAEDWIIPAAKECNFIMFIDYSTTPITIKYPDDSGHIDFPEETGTFPSVESGVSTLKLDSSYTNQILSVTCPIRKEVVENAVQSIEVRFTRGNKDSVPGNSAVKPHCSLAYTSSLGSYIGSTEYDLRGKRGTFSFNFPSTSSSPSAIATVSCTLLPGDKFHGLRLTQKN